MDPLSGAEKNDLRSAETISLFSDKGVGASRFSLGAKRAIRFSYASILGVIAINVKPEAVCLYVFF